MNNIFILDGQTDEVLGHINKKYVIDNEHEKDLPSHKDYFRFTVLAENKHAEHLTKRNGLIIPGEDGELLEFRIFESIKYRNNEGLFVEVHALATYLDLKTQKIFDPQKTSSETALQHTITALDGTEWQVGNVEFKGVRTLDFENPFNSYDYILRIAREFELEPRFYVETDGNKVTGRYVDLVERIGEFFGRTIEFGRDLQKIERKEDTSNVVTALWVYGPQREDGTRLKVLVEDDEARQRWGRRGQHIIDYYEPQTENQNITEERLRTLGEMELRKRINAVVTYEAEILDLENVPGLENKKIRFGDTIRIKDTKFNPPLYLEARVFNVKRDVFNKANKTVQLGDYREYTEDELKALFRQMQAQIQQKISAVQAEQMIEEYAEPKKVESPTPPPIKEGENPIWVDTSKTPHVPHVVIANEWVKMSPTEAQEVGAETPQGAQEKADHAEQSAKDHADTVANQAKQEAISYSENFTINYAQKQITSSTTPPANPEIGDLWFDSSTQPPTFRRWNGSEWEKLSATTFEELEGMINKDQLPDRVIDSMKLAIDAVQEENLAENSVYAEAIQAEAVGAQAIAANAILAKHIAAGEVTANHLAADAVTADAIAAGAILAEHISANSINSSKIATEGLSFNVMKGGTATLGGPDNGNGELKVLKEDGSPIFIANSSGLVDSEGRQLVGEGGVLSQLTFVSSGELNGWQKVGWWPAGGTYENLKAYIYGYIPPNFEIVSATLYTYSRPLRFRGWSNIPDGYYHCPYLHLITYSDYRDAYLDYPWAGEYVMVYRNNTEQFITSSTWGIGSWHPEGSKDQVITGQVISRLRPGYPFVFEVRTTDSFNLSRPMDETKKSLILMELSVTGFKK